MELDPENFSSMLLNSQNTFRTSIHLLWIKTATIVCSNKKVNAGWIDMIVDNFDNRIRRFDMSWDGEDYYVCWPIQWGDRLGRPFRLSVQIIFFLRQIYFKSFIISIVAVCTFSVSVIIAAISYTMTRPINQLSRAMEKVQEGIFPFSFPTTVKTRWAS